ncbi:MAG: hypothetical protein BWK76_12480 [Desulfobulbaceae bacterium A2]|nr:MAG: hypothetical protein BWK76_12480 [Desulfobulbaceae bacterium A2]
MQQLKLQGLNDPFILLKIIQTFREIQLGEQLEILYEDTALLDELFKVLPENSYQVLGPGPQGHGGPGSIVLRKTAATSDRPPSGGCRCP